MGRKMTKTSRATEKKVPFEIKENALAVVNVYKDNGYKIISLEITSKSEPIDKFMLPVDASIVLVVGDENFGISGDILSNSDAVVYINMFGQNSSMNVIQATNIALYEITKQLV